MRAFLKLRKTFCSRQAKKNSIEKTFYFQKNRFVCERCHVVDDYAGNGVVLSIESAYRTLEGH